MGSNEFRVWCRVDERTGPGPRHRRPGQPRQGRGRPGHPGVQRRPRPARARRPPPAPARALTAPATRRPRRPPMTRRPPTRCSRRCPTTARPSRVRRGSRRGSSPPGPRPGIKASGRPDLALVAAMDGPVPAAMVVHAQPVRGGARCASRQANLRATGGTEAACGYATAVIATSGCANAATGPAGDADQAAIGEAVATALGCAAGAGPPSLDRRDRHPAARWTWWPRTIARVAGGGLAASDAALEAAAVVPAHDGLDDQDGHRDGARRPAAGGGYGGRHRDRASPRASGMIHPRMATMLSIVLTDATASPAHAARPAPRQPRRRPGTSSRWTATPAPTTRCSCSPRAPPGAASADDGPRRPRGAGGGRSRPSRGTSRASRHATARAPRRSSPAR